MGDYNYAEPPLEQEKRKRMSCGLEVECPANIKECLRLSSNDGFHFIITHTVHPRFARDLLISRPSRIISRTDRIFSGQDWNRLVVGKLTPMLNVDSEIPNISCHDKALLIQELGFCAHLSLPAILLKLTQRCNVNLAGIVYNKLVGGANYQVWIDIPMMHASRFSPICGDDEREDTWEWWNQFRTYCHYDKRLGLALELPEVKRLPTNLEIDRWLGEPVKALVINTSLFIKNQHNTFVLAKAHQDIIQRFMNLDVQYVIRGTSNDISGSYKCYWSYMNFLGKKLYHVDETTDYMQGCEDYLQNPLQPLSENLESMVYDVFEKDQIKYVEYQNAIQKALEDLPSDIDMPVIMVVGAGRGPLVQACLNASSNLQRKIKLYAIEKNPFAINTLEDRVQNEWQGQVTLILEDMRKCEPPEKADILVSELLGSFGDNELSPECLDGAQRFLKKTGISIPSSYTSFLAPLQSIKIYNEIRSNRLPDKTIESIYETPYVVHLVNYYEMAPAKEVYKFEHPDWNENRSNERYARLKFPVTQNCVLTGFVGYFETVLYKDIMLSINPKTFSKGMVSWFPIVFSLPEPVHVKEGHIIELTFWRMQSEDRVWYQWCLESPIHSGINNPNGRSFYIKKH